MAMVSVATNKRASFVSGKLGSEFGTLWGMFGSQIAELWFPYDRMIAVDGWFYPLQ